MDYRVSMTFRDGAFVSYVEKDSGEWLQAGEWQEPYPNTEEDSLVFGLIEALSQGDNQMMYYSMYEHGEPVSVTIAEEPAKTV